MILYLIAALAGFLLGAWLQNLFWTDTLCRLAAMLKQIGVKRRDILYALREISKEAGQHSRQIRRVSERVEQFKVPMGEGRHVA